jgi:predicted metal-dependent hydrolase
MSETLTVGNLAYRIRRSAKRRTVGITIDRDGSLVMDAPVGCSQQIVERIGQEKALWVHTKLAQRELLFRPRRQREFVSGESFYYLGRSHRLLLAPGESAGTPPLRLHEGRFALRRDEVARGREHFRVWYTAHGQPWLERRIAALASRIGATPQGVVIRDLGYRWGSCGVSGKLLFHWCVICLPPRIIEYLVAHELVHLIQPHHNDDFWSRMERAMPDYEARKRWLAENGGALI